MDNLNLCDYPHVLICDMGDGIYRGWLLDNTCNSYNNLKDYECYKARQEFAFYADSYESALEKYRKMKFDVAYEIMPVIMPNVKPQYGRLYRYNADNSSFERVPTKANAIQITGAVMCD